MPEPARFVIVVDDNSEFLNSTQWLLEGHGFEIASFQSAGDLLAALEKGDLDLSRPTCLLSDIRMPEMSGLELQEALRKTEYRLPVVFITGHADVALAVEAMRGGAENFLEKPFKPEQLVGVLNETIDQARAGSGDPAGGGGDDRLEQLTPREREIFDLIVDGKLNKVIAYELDISIKTVEMHRANLMRKLQADGITDLVRMALIGERRTGA